MDAPPPTQIELLCFAYAGGHGAVYAPLRRALPEWLRVEPVDLPGHGRRFREPLHSERERLVTQLTSELAGRVRAPYVLFGHSLGGLIAFELCHAFEAIGLPRPLALFVSATDAPTLREPAYDVSSDAALLATLRELGGTPPEVLASPELMELALPVLRADFTLCHGPVRRTQPRLGCPIRAFAGLRDRIAPRRLERWRDETSESFELECFEGDHFFLRSQPAAVAAAIERQLLGLLGVTAAGASRGLQTA